MRLVFTVLLDFISKVLQLRILVQEQLLLLQLDQILVLFVLIRIRLPQDHVLEWSIALGLGRLDWVK